MISQQQSQKQQVKILPYQIYLLNLFFLNSLELEQRINNELDENPFLDKGIEEDAEQSGNTKEAVKDFMDYDEYMYDDLPDHKTDYQNYFSTAAVPNTEIRNSFNFKDDAKEQLHLLEISDEDKTRGEYLIDLLSNEGFMDKPIDEVAEIMSFHFKALINISDVEYILGIIQTLDPVGIGARDIRECLLMQLNGKNSKRPDVKYACKLIENHYNDLIHHQFEKIQRSLNIDEEELKIVLDFVRSLKFHPVSENSSNYDSRNTIMPDFIINKEGESLYVDLCISRSGSLFVNQSLYDQMAQQVKKQDKAAKQYVVSKLQSANWFINAIKQREETMIRVIRSIVDFQHDYFIEGDIRLLKPMVLREIAGKTGFDISTISRITSNKYAETHFGTIWLKELFSEGIEDKKGNVISNKVIQSLIEEAIAAEDKQCSYTDGQLANILAAKGYNIARRTVAKYREQMHIPIAQIRTLIK
jgi:RNA polymerase sigma-54 factor